MSRVLTSFGFGSHAELLEISLPGFARYAAAHEYELFIPTKEFFGGDFGTRPFAWLKLPLIKKLFADGASEILWIDADVVVMRFDKDIADDCSGAAINLVVQKTRDGSVPSTGVMRLASQFADYIDDLWGRSNFSRSGGWWEQAAVIDLLGGDPDATPVAVPAGPLWSELPYEWNPHVRDSRGVPAGCRFFHATSFPDRVSCMREAARDAAT